jgi:hypothetical protein
MNHYAVSIFPNLPIRQSTLDICTHAYITENLFSIIIHCLGPWTVGNYEI